jgi:hypothetical protein
MSHLMHSSYTLVHLYGSVISPSLLLADTVCLLSSLLIYSPFHDDIICDRPCYDGTLAGVAISCEWMIFNLTYSEPSVQPKLSRPRSEETLTDAAKNT